MPIQFNNKIDRNIDIYLPKFVPSDDVICFLEKPSPSLKFESVDYEIKIVNDINVIYLTINPDPRNLEFIPPNNLVLSYHKISVYKNRVNNQIITDARNKFP